MIQICSKAFITALILLNGINCVAEKAVATSLKRDMEVFVNFEAKKKSTSTVSLSLLRNLLKEVFFEV